MNSDEFSIKKFTLEDLSTIAVETTFKESLIEFKIFNITSGVGYSGDLLMAVVLRTADKLEIPFDSFLTENKNLFKKGDEESNFKFTLTKNSFSWTKCGEISIVYGKIAVLKEDNLQNGMLLKLVTVIDQQVQLINQKDETINRIQQEQATFVTDFNKLIDDNQQKEKEMYTKFCLLLNTKKQRIAELESILERKPTRTLMMSCKQKRHIRDSISDLESQNSKQYESSQSQEMLCLDTLPLRKRLNEASSSNTPDREVAGNIAKEPSDNMEDNYDDDTEKFFDNM